MRRLNLAAALLHDPQLLLLDEPTVGVDPQSRNAIFDNLETLKKQGKTLLYTTHYMEEAERLCDRMVIIDHGKVIADDTLQVLPGVQSVEVRARTLRIGIRDLAADKYLEVKPSGLEQAREAVRKGKAMVAVVIPKDFGADAGRAFFNGAARKPEIGVLYDPSHGAEMSMVQGILTGHVMEAVSKEMFNGQTGRDVVRDTLAELDQFGMPAEQKKSLRELLQGVQGLNAGREAGNGFAQEALREGLTLPYQVHFEAVTSGAGVRYTSMFVLMVLFGFARVVFGVRIQGSTAGFLGVCAAFSLMTAAWGLLIAALGKTPEATRGLAIVTTLLMVMLGGAWVPTFVFPPWLQRLTVVIPTRWAMDGLDATTWRGLGFSAAALPIALLSGCALAFGALAVMRFRWEADG